MLRIYRKISENLRRVRARRFVRQKLRPVIEADGFREIRQQCTGSEPYYKYFKTDQYMVRNAERVLRLGLDKSPPKRVLDLGCGFGYFMLCCKLCGHEAVGVDLPSDLFDRVLALFGLRKVVHRIEAFQKLPELPGGPFDLVTAFEMRFDEIEFHKPWTVAMWKAFLGDLAGRMTPGGTLVLKFNGPNLYPELREYFRKLGASIDRRFVVVEDFPAKLAAAGH